MSIQGVLHVAAASQAQPVSPPAKTNGQSGEIDANPTAITVSLSGEGKAASAAQAALQEATETTAQTAKEARSGDHQAQRLLAKEEAAKAATAGDGASVDKLV